MPQSFDPAPCIPEIQYFVAGKFFVVDLMVTFLEP
jgi:hypothetical protein